MNFHVHQNYCRFGNPGLLDCFFLANQRTLEYRINGAGENNRGGGVGKVRHNNNRGVGIIGGGCLEE